MMSDHLLGFAGRLGRCLLLFAGGFVECKRVQGLGFRVCLGLGFRVL